MLFESLAGVQHRFVFDRCGDHVLVVAARSFHDPEDGVIVGFGASTGENDLLWPRPNQGRDGLPRGFHRRACPLAKGVNGGGIAKVGRQKRQHGLKHFLLDGRRGVVV